MDTCVGLSWWMAVGPETRFDRWARWSGGKRLLEMNGGGYGSLCVLANNRRVAAHIAESVAVIGVDVPRSFQEQDGEWAGEGARQSLIRILQAWAVARHDIGYTQGINALATRVLRVYVEQGKANRKGKSEVGERGEERVFWVLMGMLCFVFDGWFDPGLGRIRRDGELFAAILKTPSAFGVEGVEGECVENVGRVLEESGLDPLLFLPQWFLTLFTHVFDDHELVCRIWDVVLDQGVVGAFEVGLELCRAVWEVLGSGLGEGGGGGGDDAGLKMVKQLTRPGERVCGLVGERVGGGEDDGEERIRLDGKAMLEWERSL